MSLLAAGLDTLPGHPEWESMLALNSCTGDVFLEQTLEGLLFPWDGGTLLVLRRNSSPGINNISFLEFYGKFIVLIPATIMYSNRKHALYG